LRCALHEAREAAKPAKLFLWNQQGRRFRERLIGFEVFAASGASRERAAQSWPWLSVE